MFHVQDFQDRSPKSVSVSHSNRFRRDREDKETFNDTFKGSSRPPNEVVAKVTETKLKNKLPTLEAETKTKKDFSAHSLFVRYKEVTTTVNVVTTGLRANLISGDVSSFIHTRRMQEEFKENL